MVVVLLLCPSTARVTLAGALSLVLVGRAGLVSRPTKLMEFTGFCSFLVAGPGWRPLVNPDRG